MLDELWARPQIRLSANIKRNWQRWFWICERGQKPRLNQHDQNQQHCGKHSFPYLILLLNIFLRNENFEPVAQPLVVVNRDEVAQYTFGPG